MASAQRLRNVCNGCHIYNLYELTEKRLIEILQKNDNRGILITDYYQDATNTLLTKIIKRRRGPLKVKKLCKWSIFGTLWFATYAG